MLASDWLALAIPTKSEQQIALQSLGKRIGCDVHSFGSAVDDVGLKRTEIDEVVP